MFYEDADINKLIEKTQKFVHFRFENGSLPTLTLNMANFSVITAMNYLIEFLVGLG